MRDPLFGANHFTAIRWILASAVAVRHIWGVTTGAYPNQIYGWEAGYMAVNGFFILSGLLIAKSLMTRADLKSYAQSRILRIYPALIFVLLAFAFIFSPFFASPGGIERIFAAETWQYVLRVLLMGDPDGAPGGIFAASSKPDFNGALWTIRIEMAAYILAALAYYFGAIKTFKRTFVLYLTVQIAYLVAPFILDIDNLPESIVSLLRLSSAFLMGMTLWHWPAARRPAWWIVMSLVGLFLLIGNTWMGEVTANFALAALLMRLGLPQNPLNPIVKLPDYSYGIYIWHYPAMQSVLFFIPGLGPWALLALATPATLVLSAVSWHLIEKPALRLKPGRKSKIRQVGQI